GRCLRPPGDLLLAALRRRAIRLQARDADLHADVPLPLLQQRPGRLLHSLERVAARVAVGVHGLAALAPEELVNGQPGPLAEDVPQGHINAADRVPEHRAVPPVRADEARLPGVLDQHWVLADEERPEV